MSGFMDSHKHWMIIDEEEPAVVHAEEPPSTENDEEGGWEHDEGDHDDGEDVEHVVVDDVIQVENNVDADMGQTPLISAVRDPHVQELLTKKTTDARGAAREKAKLR